MYTNKDTVKVKVGNTYIGGDAPISIQSMLCVPAHDIKGNVEQAAILCVLPFPTSKRLKP